MPEKKAAPQGARRARRAKLRRRRALRKLLWRCALCVLTVVALALVSLLWAGHVAFLGPSQTMGDLLTVTMLETSALKFVPRIYYSKAQVEQIVARNSVAQTDEEVNTSLISIGAAEPSPEAPEESLSPDASPSPEPTPTPLPTPKSGALPIIDEDGIQIYELKGSTYHGYMTVVLDPSRVSVGICGDRFSSSAGKQLNQIAKRYDAVAAINGGAFEDDGGSGNGGQPVGLVVSQGKLYNNASGDRLVIGFTEDDILVFGNWTTQQAHKWKLRDAVTFGPALIYNGEPVAAKGAGSGLNPRTGIGQRADGAVLMLIIEGRNASSLGGTYADMIEVMLDFGAVNAANLDGGSSSMLYYQGEYISNGVVLTGSRNLPTAFVVN